MSSYRAESTITTYARNGSGGKATGYCIVEGKTRLGTALKREVDIARYRLNRLVREGQLGTVERYPITRR